MKAYLDYKKYQNVTNGPKLNSIIKIKRRKVKLIKMEL